MAQSCKGASAFLVPPNFWKIAFFDNVAVQPSSLPEFYLHPHYREHLPVEATLNKIEAGSDAFVTEKYAAQIETILVKWSAGLREYPLSIDAIEGTVAIDFSGSPLTAGKKRTIRSGAIEIWQTSFSQLLVNREPFLQTLRRALNSFSRIQTAEFQITRINVIPPRIQTRVRYDLVGSGNIFYREQRTGCWELEWEQVSTGAFALKTWTAYNETCSRTAMPLFEDVTSAAFGTNASYLEQLLHGSDYWRTVLDGACGIDVYGHNGISVGDIDGDGYDDLYVCQPAGLPNRLYRNRGGGTFEDITENSGVGILDNTACALFADIDNDGRQDLIVVTTGGPLLFLNDGNGKFREKPGAFKFASPLQGAFTGAAIADYDRDGWLDIYFCLYIYYQGSDQYKYPLPYYDANNGPQNFLMRNNHDGTFSDVTGVAGLNENNTRYSFCCGWNDYNNDGWPDLYVVNDFGRKNLYRNNGDGTFTDVAARLGVEDVGAGMSACWFDYDNDGAEDLYVANMWTAAGERISTQNIFKKDSPQQVRALYQKHAMGNSLLRNRGKDFADVTQAAGVGMGRWAWSSDAWDFDHDGSLDLYVANGMVSGPSSLDLNSFFWRQTVANSPDDPKPAHNYEQGWNAINESIRADGTWSGYERNVFYANNGDGTFSDVSGAVGMDFPEDGRSFALADFDRDGRLEVFLKNRNAPQLRLLKSVMEELPPSISFRLRGTKSNRDAIGAVITLRTDKSRQIRSLQAGSGFLSQHSKEVHFGLGEASGMLNASIRWPSGLVQELHGLPSNHTIWVEEGSSPSRMEPFKQTKALQATWKQAGGADKVPVYQPETLPRAVETWLLSPISAPDFSLPDANGTIFTLSAQHGSPILLTFWSSEIPNYREMLLQFEENHKVWSQDGLKLLAINVDRPDSTASLRKLVNDLHLSFSVLLGLEDTVAIYNLLYRYMFDRHRDLSLPSAFLINAKGEIVKVYQGKIPGKIVDHDFRHIPQTSAERLTVALPFSGASGATEFSRNHLAYGSIFFQRGYYDEAGGSFQRAARDNPESAEAQYGLGSVYLKQGKDTEAKQSFRRVTELRAAYPDTLANAWNNLGLLATRNGRTAEAIQYFQHALMQDPDHLIALENLGNAYRQQKEWEDARQILEHAVAVGPQDPEANYGLGMVYAQLNDADRAYEYLQRALKFRPVYPEALNNIGILYLRTNRRDQAIESFQESIRVAPDFDQSYLSLARVYVIENSPDNARSVLLELLKRRPDHAIAKSMLQALDQK